jgi:hypothetical protein
LDGIACVRGKEAIREWRSYREMGAEKMTKPVIICACRLGTSEKVEKRKKKQEKRT